MELKTGIILYPEIEEKVLALTASMGMEDRVIYSSFCHPSPVRLKELDSGLKTGLLYSDGWIGAADYGRHTVGRMPCIRLCTICRIRSLSRLPEGRDWQ